MRFIEEPDTYMDTLQDASNFVVAKQVTDEDFDILASLGFQLPSWTGQTILPNPNYNKWTDENVNGKVVIRRDLPRDEPYYQEITWKFKDENGENKIGKTTIQKFRFRREIVQPRNEPLYLNKSPTGEVFVTSKNLLKINREEALFVMNMFISIFGSFEVLRPNLTRNNARSAKLWLLDPQESAIEDRIRKLFSV